MTSLLPSGHREHPAEALAILDELTDAGDYQSVAWNLIALTEYRRQITDLLRAVEDALVDYAPWTGGMLDGIDGIPPLELRTGSVRKKWDWPAIQPYMRRQILDPKGTGELPSEEVVEAVDETLALIFDLAPLTASNGPRVKPLAAVLKPLGRDVDEFCESTPGRQTVQIHGETSS